MFCFGLLVVVRGVVGFPRADASCGCMHEHGRPSRSPFWLVLTNPPKIHHCRCGDCPLCRYGGPGGVGRDEKQALELFAEVCGAGHSSGRLLRTPSVKLTDPPLRSFGLDRRCDVHPSPRTGQSNHIKLHTNKLHTSRQSKPNQSIISTTTSTNTSTGGLRRGRQGPGEDGRAVRGGPPLHRRCVRPVGCVLAWFYRLTRDVLDGHIHPSRTKKKKSPQKPITHIPKYTH